MIAGPLPDLGHPGILRERFPQASYRTAATQTFEHPLDGFRANPLSRGYREPFEMNVTVVVSYLICRVFLEIVKATSRRGGQIGPGGLGKADIAGLGHL